MLLVITLAALVVLVFGAGLPGSIGAWAGLFALALAGARLDRRLGVLVGVALGGMLARSVPQGPVLRGPSVVRGVVASAPMGRVADLAVEACGMEALRPCRGRVRVVFPEPPALGSHWLVAGDAAAPADRGPSGGPGRVWAARLVGVRSVLRADRASPIGARGAERPVREGPRAVLAAVATGDRRGVDEATWRVLRDTGTSHLLAISGFHVGVVAGSIGGLVAWGCRRLGAVRPAGISTVWAWWVGAGAGALYAWAAGAPISAQRAAGVLVLAALGRSLGRDVDPWRLIAFAALAVCVVDPGAVATPGFQLSFGAVAGLLRFSVMLDPWVQRLPRGLRWIGRGASATFGATLGTLPAAAWWFQSLSVTSPVANVLAVPFMAFAIVPFAALAEWGPEALAPVGVFVGERAVGLMLWGLSWGAVAPLAPAVGPLGAVLLCGVFVRARVGWMAAVSLLVLGLRTRSAGGLEVTFFDVGQGDAALVEYPDGRRWLIDGGRGPGLLAALRRRGVRGLDRVVASHGDADHAAGLVPVLRSLRVGVLELGRLRGHEALVDAASEAGVPVEVRGVGVGGSDNDTSLVTRIPGRWGDFLFTGDVEAAGEARIRTPAAVLKVPHHGSATSSSAGLLDRVRPRVAVVSVGWNRFGHPSSEVTARYARRGIPLLRTDLDGTVTVRMDPRGLWVYSETEGRWTRLDGFRPAKTPNTAMANTASSKLMPWL